jgi:two-component system nitrogen regulation sensor histidine kinase NtrY
MTRRMRIGIGLRALSIGVLAYVSTHLLAQTHLYATSTILILAVCVITADVSSSMRRLQRSFERVLVNATAAPTDRPSADHAGREPVAATLEKVTDELIAQRVEQQQRVSHLQALLDTVTTALIILRADGAVVPVNRSARRLIGDGAGRLSDLPVFGEEAARIVSEMAPGAKQVVAFASSDKMLVSVARFSAPGSAPQRLIAIQRIAGELDAVEVKAWHDVSRVLAHEIMNSLTPIASLSESLESLAHAEIGALGRDATEPSELIAALGVIKRRSHGLMSFVERYRQLAELPLANFMSIRADRFMQGIERLMSASLRERGIRFRCHVTSDFSFTADPELIEQALINLISNAADAVAGAAEPAIDIRCELREARIILEVIDNGRGLRDTERDQILLPFFSTKPNGSGIGLSIARHVALAHGGQLDINANEPSGCTFSLMLPERSTVVAPQFRGRIR